MNLYWVVNLIVWAAAGIYASKAAYYAAFRQRSARRGDAMRLAVFLVALIMCAHITRWLWAPNDLGSWKAIYIVGFLTGLYVLRLMHAYGRGEPVHLLGRFHDEEYDDG